MTDLAEIRPVTETRVVEGIRLPYSRGPFRYLGQTEPETGEVFVEQDDLISLAEQETWDSQFGNILLMSEPQATACEQAGLAVRETRGGLHGTVELRDLLRRLGWY